MCRHTWLSPCAFSQIPCYEAGRYSPAKLHLEVLINVSISVKLRLYRSVRTVANTEVQRELTNQVKSQEGIYSDC